MPRYALIQSGRVHEVFEPFLVEGREVPMSDRFTPELVAQMVEVPANVAAEAGWSYDPQAGFAAPAPPDAVVSVPAVTMRQARLALLAAGVLDNVETVIDALPAAQKARAKIEWEFAANVERDSEFVKTLAPALGLTNSELDSLFIHAATL